MAIDRCSCSYRWRRNTMDFPHYNQRKLARAGGKGGEGQSRAMEKHCSLLQWMDAWRPPAPALTWLLVVQYPSAQPPLHRSFHPRVRGKSRECLHCCHQTSSWMEEDMRRCECSKGRSSWNGPAPGKTLSSPVMVSARLPVPPASEPPCACQHTVELLMMGHLFTAVCF